MPPANANRGNIFRSCLLAGSTEKGVSPFANVAFGDLSEMVTSVSLHWHEHQHYLLWNLCNSVPELVWTLLFLVFPLKAGDYQL